MKKKTKKKITKFINQSHIKSTGYKPQHFGNSKVTSYEISGIIDSFCMCSEWPSGEGFDFSFTTKGNSDKSISLHSDELEIMLACLNKLGYFNE